MKLALSILLAIAVGQIGAATWYPASRFEGRPLYCDTAFPGQALRYDRATAAAMGPWVALNVRAYQEGKVSCGDEVLLFFDDGTKLRARALDAGPFDGYWVEDYGPGVPILVDVPEYWRTESGLVLLVVLHGDLENP